MSTKLLFEEVTSELRAKGRQAACKTRREPGRGDQATVSKCKASRDRNVSSKSEVSVAGAE